MAQSSTARAWARGGVVLAATVLLLVGIYQIFLGIAALAKNQFFVVTPNYAYTVNINTWGWIHLGIGIVAALTGLALFTGNLWARIVGVAILVISAVANFFFLPYYPFWSLLIIALDIFAIWAIANTGRGELTSDASMGATAGYGGERGDQSGDRWPSTNQATGRHWAGEPAKEGVGNRGTTERQQAEAMAQPGMSQPGTSQQGMSPGMSQPGMSQPPQSGQPGMGGSGMPRDPGSTT